MILGIVPVRGTSTFAKVCGHDADWGPLVGVGLSVKLFFHGKRTMVLLTSHQTLGGMISGFKELIFANKTSMETTKLINFKIKQLH